MTQMGGRSTFSPVNVSVDQHETLSEHTPCSPQQQVVLQRLELFLHCVGGICKWDGGGEVGFQCSPGTAACDWTGNFSMRFGISFMNRQEYLFDYA